ncbi:hypothetical protein GBF38_015693 [Nibea albiflora]|nr:hypothetical protein GBF38_015693 [Nibea albiflora]
MTTVVSIVLSRIDLVARIHVQTLDASFERSADEWQSGAVRVETPCGWRRRAGGDAVRVETPCG